MIRSALCAMLAAVATLAQPVQAQPGIEPIQTYALTNARIVVAPGNVIESGTVVLRDGRIVAVGANVDAPADAVTLDLAGSTVYPGLIDAAATTGLPSVTRATRGPQGGPPGSFQQARQASEPPPRPPEIRPDLLAADVFEPQDDELERWRATGVTTLGLAFDGGIFPGQTAAVSVVPGEHGTYALRTPVSLQVLLGRRRGGYPGTLMGSLAFIRQAFHDAQHAIHVEEAFARDAASAPRPSYAPEHRALAPAVGGALPVWIHASAERDIGRAIELATDVGVENYVIVGAQEGYRSVDALRGVNRPLIVSLDWPRPDAVTGRAYEMHIAPIDGEDEAGAEADSAAALTLRNNAAALTGAGLRVALSGYGLDGPSQFRTHLLAAVEAGLSPEDALRALTVTPAELLGLDALVGTIENGKLANVVVVEGDLFDEDGKIRQVFVEGRRYEIPDEPPRAQRRAAAGDAATVDGEWTGSIEMAGTMMPFTLTLAEQDGQLSGEISSEMGATALAGERTGDQIVLEGTFAPPGMNAMALSITGQIRADELEGTITVQGQAPIAFSARRRTPGSARMMREGGRP